MAKQPEPPLPPQDITPPGLESRMDPKPRHRAPGYRPAGKLTDKVALITGGDSGIGRAVAVMFAREGADIAIVYLPEEERDADGTAREVRASGRDVLRIPGDVSDPEFCRAAVGRVVERHGRLDILVNNAAYQNHCDEPEDVSLDQWEHTFRTNVYGYFHMIRYSLGHMPRGASIINTGSVVGLEGSARLLDYSATKGAIHALTKSLAQSLVRRGIRVNCVAPGPVWTPLNPAERSDEDIEHFGAGTPMERPAQPEEIAPAYVYFASDADSGYVSGHVLPLLGGGTTAG